MLVIFVLVMCASSVYGAVEGDACSINGVNGICTDLRKCTLVAQDNKNRKMPQICTYVDKNPVVCCLDGVSTGPVKNTEKRSTTPESTPAIVKDYSAPAEKACDPIPPSLTANKTGQKAWDKCIEYQQLVHPCQKAEGSDKMVRQNRCPHNSEELIFSNEVKRLEYPHAVILGYGNDSKNLSWLCGGALISDRFILTAAHCIRSREYGPVSYAALHVLDRTKIDPDHLHKIKNIIAHPEYKSPKVYHDIALLELENPISLDSSTVPACLKTRESGEERQNAISVSWDNYSSMGSTSTVLQKFHLTKYSAEECSTLYPLSRRGTYNDTMHTCYGDRSESHTLCSDVGGSALLLKSKLHCMYTILGVTSFGRRCFTNGPGVYMRVEPYVPWIESVVWP